MELANRPNPEQNGIQDKLTAPEVRDPVLARLAARAYASMKARQAQEAGATPEAPLAAPAPSGPSEGLIREGDPSVGTLLYPRNPSATYKEKEENSVKGEPPLSLSSVGAPTPIKTPRWILYVADDPEAPARHPQTQRRTRNLQALAGLLYRLARETLRAQGVSRAALRAVGTVVLHLPVDLLADHLGVHRSTLWRWAKVLEDKGFLARRVHRGTLEREVDGEKKPLPVATGTVWAVRVRPGKARLTYEDLKHPWRDMQADVAQGITAWAWKQAGARPGFQDLLAWTVGARRGPARGEMPVGLEAIPYLREASPRDLPHLITVLADYLAGLLRDQGSRRFYAGLLWRVARGELNGWALYQAVRRVLVDLREGWARKPGALLVARLRVG